MLPACRYKAAKRIQLADYTLVLLCSSCIGKLLLMLRDLIFQWRFTDWSAHRQQREAANPAAPVSSAMLNYAIDSLAMPGSSSILLLKSRLCRFQFYGAARDYCPAFDASAPGTQAQSPHPPNSG